MAGSYVRTLTRQWLAAIGSPPFYDTINRVVRPPEDVWMTVEFFTTSKQGTINSPGYIETGIIDLIFVAKPGQGDEPVLAALELALAEFLGNTDPANALTLTGSEPVRELTAGGADSSYRLGVGVTYAYSV